MDLETKSYGWKNKTKKYFETAQYLLVLFFLIIGNWLILYVKIAGIVRVSIPFVIMSLVDSYFKSHI